MTPGAFTPLRNNTMRTPADYKCGRCRRTTEQGAEFYARRSRKNGTASHCKNCALECQAEHYHRSETRREKVRINASRQYHRIGQYIADYKLAIGCSGCELEPGTTLLFVNRETAKPVKLSEARSRSIHVAKEMMESNLPLCYKCLSAAKKSDKWPARLDCETPGIEDY